mmetsp:Transcript_16017/g.26162  ORF Transcript_16017/g.26162 Transcript_16017/m.26162 type:complete len:110 (+) Transcript_16017:428-757(+)
MRSLEASDVIHAGPQHVEAIQKFFIAGSVMDTNVGLALNWYWTACSVPPSTQQFNSSTSCQNDCEQSSLGLRLLRGSAIVRGNCSYRSRAPIASFRKLSSCNQVAQSIG